MDLDRIFELVAAEMRRQREALNELDATNHNHGDHMVAIFELASQAAESSPGALPEAMQHASRLLSAQADNASARVYAQALARLAEQFRRRGLTTDELAAAMRGMVRPDLPGVQSATGKSAEVSKAVLDGLALWAQGQPSAPGDEAGAGAGMDMGFVFGLGVAYMQAKARGSDKMEAMAEAVVASSPLNLVAHRRASGLLAFRALLQAFEQTLEG